MKKRILSLLLCASLLVSTLSVTALAADSAAPSGPQGEPILYLNGEKMAADEEGGTLTFENGGTATLTTAGENETGGTDYALTLENVRATKSVHQDIGGELRAAGLYFLGSGQNAGTQKRDTLSITLKGTNFILAQGEADDASATALVSVGSVSISGEGSLNLMAMPSQGAETSCSGTFIIGDVSVGSTVYCSVQTGRALLLSGDVTFADGATLRWPTELTLTESGMKVLMNGEAAADMMVVAAPTDSVNRSVAVFNLWRVKGSPAPEGEYPFTDEPMGGFMRDAIHWAGSTGLAKGYGDGTFGCNDPITNEQFAVLFYRLIGSPAVEGGFPADYPYAGSVSSWARDAMLRAVSQSWKVDPKGILTHAEMDRLVAILSRRD